MKKDKSEGSHLRIQSLERGLVALEMAANNGVRISELAQALGVDRSTAYRLLYTLTANGYLENDPASRKYIANAKKLFLLTGQVAASRVWTTVAVEYMRLLRDQTRQTANLAVVEDYEAIIVGREFAVETPTVLQALGSRRPVHASAAGKAIIAFLPEAEIEQIVQHKGLVRLTAKTITDIETLIMDLRRVRARGYAFDDEETFAGVRCLAAPIYDYTNRIVGAIGISGPTSHVTLERIPDLAEVVRRTAGEFSIALGYPNHQPLPEPVETNHRRDRRKRGPDAPHPRAKAG